jgi:DNA-binding MarR family transcriptional regulator
MAPEQSKTQPIGYWLKRADELITLRSNEALQEFGLTRFHWQVFSSIREAGRLNKEQLLVMLKDFLDEARLDQIIADLRAKAWVAYEVDRGGARLGLTRAGEDMYGQVLEQQKQVRSRVMSGISESEYEALIRTLQHIVENLQ